MKTIRAFFWFAAVTVLVDCLVASVPSLADVRKALVPFTGIPASVPYVFPICLWPGLLARGRADMSVDAVERHARFSGYMLCVFAAIGACAFLYFGGAHHARSPWLRVSAWRPLWTVLLPSVWAYLLLSAVGRAEPAPAPVVATRSEPSATA